MAESKRIGGLVGPTIVAIVLSEFPLVQPHLYEAQIPPVVYLSGVLLFVAGLAIVRAHNRWARDWTVPCTLRPRIRREIEYDGNMFRQEGADVWCERIVPAGRALDESRYIGDLARKKPIQELVLYKENGMFSLGQISRESGFTGRHFAAQENQLR